MLIEAGELTTARAYKARPFTLAAGDKYDASTCACCGLIPAPLPAAQHHAVRNYLYMA